MADFRSRIQKFAREEGILADISLGSKEYSDKASERSFLRTNLRYELLAIDPRIPLLSDRLIVEEILSIILFIDLGPPKPSGLISKISDEVEVLLDSCPKDINGVYDGVSYNSLRHTDIDSDARSRE